MRNFIFFLFFSALFPLHSQTWDRAFLNEKLGFSRIFHDSSGFIYSLGYDADSCQGSYYGGTGLTLLKIKKLDPVSGGCVWEKKILSSTFFRIAEAVFIRERIFIGGAFKGNLCYDSTCVNSNGNGDIAYISVSLNGTYPGIVRRSSILYVAKCAKGVPFLYKKFFCSDDYLNSLIRARITNPRERGKLAGVTNEEINKG